MSIEPIKKSDTKFYWLSVNSESYQRNKQHIDILSRISDASSARLKQSITGPPEASEGACPSAVSAPITFPVCVSLAYLTIKGLPPNEILFDGRAP
ncbi:hypothetical protein BDFB_009477 [Asbolus verrucosus]|uniref:Uncharacterized protein n=1 Tax=Asbolus verrucosus TaxID=1661398 RepID=A0A482VMB3_ASBVE|nr:hypothetical protein BDFB_009477 [Asbolus verrucosus]